MEQLVLEYLIVFMVIIENLPILIYLHTKSINVQYLDPNIIKNVMQSLKIYENNFWTWEFQFLKTSSSKTFNHILRKKEGYSLDQIKMT